MVKGIYNKILVLELIIILLFSGVVFAGKGCCSWHGGQAYCDSHTGRRVCNDGSYSPTCRCGGGGYSNNYISYCPKNSYRGTDGECYCKEGYKANLELNICENMNYSCNKKYYGTVYRAYDDKCVCPYDGYGYSSWDKNINNCPINDKYCKYYDENSIYLGNGYCGCKEGYEISHYGNACIKTSFKKGSKSDSDREKNNSNSESLLGILLIGGIYLLSRI